MSEQPEFYPMPGFPTLAVRDLAASVAWYRAVGFANVFEMPMLAHLRWARYADLLLRPEPGLQGPKGIGVTLTFGTRDTADLSVIVPEEPGEVEVGEAKESCSGGGIVKFRRGFEVPAMPTP